jgi:hypothetical protein
VVTADGRREFAEPVIVLDLETVYKKIDSTLRGNIGAELGALERIYGGPIAYVRPIRSSDEPSSRRSARTWRSAARDLFCA